MIDEYFPENIKVINLIENYTDNENLTAEHGLSLYVKADNMSFIVDSGQSGAFIDNAKMLGIDFQSIDFIFLSHNHYDHIGGLKRLLDCNKNIKVIASRNCLIPTLKVLSDEDISAISKYGGVKLCELKSEPKDIGGFAEIYKEHQNRFILVDEEYKLAEHIYIEKPINSYAEFVCRDAALAKLDTDTQRIQRDDFGHELFMVIERKNDVILISSCSHSGIVNIADTAYRKFNKPISTVIGGFHMRGKDGDNSLNCTEEFIRETSERLEDFGVKKIYTGHCTGILALEVLKSYFGDRVEHFKTGEIIEITQNKIKDLNISKQIYK